MRLCLLLLLLCVASTSALARAYRVNYPSGLLEREENSPAHGWQSESDALAALFRSYFPDPSTGWEWRKVTRFEDRTHVHGLFDLRFQGVRIVDQLLNTHYHRAGGFLQYVSSSWQTKFSLSRLRPRTGNDESRVRDQFLTYLTSKYGPFTGALHFEPVIWVDELSGEGRSAFEVELSWSKRGLFETLILDSIDGSIRSEKSLVRHYTAVGQQVYLSNPLAGGGALDTVNLTDLNDSASLQNGFIHVRRDENPLLPTLKEIDPTILYSTTGTPAFDPDPNNYGGTTCQASGSATCPNESFDGVNIYYHLDQYRNQLSTTFLALGLDTTVASDMNDPIDVIVNSLSVDLYGTGDPTSYSNNAAYVNSTCRETFTPTFPRCLVFLRPSTGTTDSCGIGRSPTVEFFDIAREGNAVVHEYQHYITDRITRMIRGSTTLPLVGDALHEGYSDYFGASETTRLSGVPSNQIGAYAFQNCGPLIRDVSVIKEYANSAEDRDPHVAGLSWASGLWSLRAQLGVSGTDQLALKSLFFLPVKANWVSAVESLVQADGALNGGANAALIRTLFYDQIKLVGGQAGFLRDPASGVVEIGFHSCSAVHERGAIPFAGFAIFLIWLSVTIGAGRRFRLS